MKNSYVFVPLLAIAMCTMVFAEPRAGLFRTASLPVAEETSAPISLVGFFHAHRGGGGYGPSCGCDVAAPTCGFEPSCAAAPSCGYEPSCGCEDVCAPRCRKKLFGHLFHKHRGCNSCEVSCGCEPTCGAAPSCGCDAAPVSCGKHSHFGHRLCGCGGCSYGHRCGHVCKPHRHWGNGWCGQTCDGFSCGNPPSCIGGDVGYPADKGIPTPEAMPMEEPNLAPMKSTWRPALAPRFTAKPIGAGIK